MTPTGAFLTLTGLFVLYEGFRFLSVKQMNLSLSSVDAAQDNLTTNVQLGIKVANPTQWTNTIHLLERVRRRIGDISELRTLIRIPAAGSRDRLRPVTKIMEANNSLRLAVPRLRGSAA